MDVDILTDPMVAFKPRQRLVEEFAGREDILTSMRSTHFEDSNQQRSRPITVLTGMGGLGKTQIALKFACEFEEK